MGWDKSETSPRQVRDKFETNLKQQVSAKFEPIWQICHTFQIWDIFEASLRQVWKHSCDKFETRNNIKKFTILKKDRYLF